MRSGFLFLAAALVCTVATPIAAEACCFFCCGGPRYAPAAPSYYPQPMPGMVARPMPVAPTNVTAKDNVFEPISVTIQQGTTVSWVNSGKNIHTVTSDNGKFDSGDIPPGGVFRATFVTPGTYKYHCKHHRSMVGTIIVEAPKVKVAK